MTTKKQLEGRIIKLENKLQVLENKFEDFTKVLGDHLNVDIVEEDYVDSCVECGDGCCIYVGKYVAQRLVIKPRLPRKKGTVKNDTPPHKITVPELKQMAKDKGYKIIKKKKN